MNQVDVEDDNDQEKLTPEDLEWGVTGGTRDPHTPYEDYKTVKRKVNEEKQLKPVVKKIQIPSGNNNNNNNQVKSLGKGVTLSQPQQSQVVKSVGRGKTVARMRA